MARERTASEGLPERPVIYWDRKSCNALAIFMGLDAEFTHDASRADLIWLRGRYSEAPRDLGRFQLLNHIPNERALVTKGPLASHLKAFDPAQGTYDLSLSDFLPETYRLDLDDDRRAFLDRLPGRDSRENPWIVKPSNLSQGKGIRILWRFDWLRDLYAKPGSDGADLAIDIDGHDKFVIQRYIRNPLLLEGRKSEVRLYFLIACLDPLLVLLYREGTVRLNSLPFKLDDFDNVLIHVTNVYQQERHPDFDPGLRLKWDFAELQAYLTHELKIAGPRFIERELKPRLKKILAFAVDATIAELRETPPRGQFFGLYGADIILDDRLRPWLTEVQLNPGLSHDDPVKKRIVPAMLREAARIVLEVRARRRGGETLKGLEAPDGFEWVIDRA